MISDVEHILRQIPEVESTSRRTGLQLGLAAVTEANTGDISVKLKPAEPSALSDVISRGAGEDQPTGTDADRSSSSSCCRT